MTGLFCNGRNKLYYICLSHNHAKTSQLKFRKPEDCKVIDRFV